MTEVWGTAVAVTIVAVGEKETLAIMAQSTRPKFKGDN